MNLSWRDDFVILAEMLIWELVVQCRARRLLNPFRGVMQTLEAGHVDAASVDGLRWGLYITDESVYNFIDLNSVAPFYSAEVKYGEWSERQGLVRAPSLPSMNQERVREWGQEILALVREHSAQVPFPLRDNYERWLLDDEQGQPAVLLESAYQADEAKYHSNTLWRVGPLARREFETAGEGINTGKAERLQRLINQYCQRGRSLWVRREADGRGVVLARPGGESPGGPGLAADSFPRHGIREQWPDTELSQLVAAYLRWLSPWLLVMSNDIEDVECLIQQAVQYPRRLFQIRRLLPEVVLARKEIKAALVQAELSRSD